VDDSKRSRSAKPKPKRSWFKVFVTVFLVVFIAGGAAFAYVANKTFQTAKQSEVELSRGDKSDKRAAAVDLTKDHFSVLLVGTDERPGDTSSRADTMIVATFNKTDKQVNLLSIPRDSLVMIPSVGYEDKINHSYAFGGIDSTIETVETLLDIPIDYYGSIKINGAYYYQLDPSSLADAKTMLKEQLNLPETADDSTTTPEVSNDSTVESN